MSPLNSRNQQNQGSFSYTSRAVFLFFLLLSGEFLLHIPWLLCFSVGSFSYTSHASFIFMRGVPHTHPVLSTVLCKEFYEKKRQQQNKKSNTVTKDKQLGKKRKKVALRREKGALQHPKQRTSKKNEWKIIMLLVLTVLQIQPKSLFFFKNWDFGWFSVFYQINNTF